MESLPSFGQAPGVREPPRRIAIRLAITSDIAQAKCFAIKQSDYSNCSGNLVFGDLCIDSAWHAIGRAILPSVFLDVQRSPAKRSCSGSGASTLERTRTYSSSPKARSTISGRTLNRKNPGAICVR